MSIWQWLNIQVLYAIHARQLVEHGGRRGLRDADAILSALARPPNKAAYGRPDVADLAAAYAYGLTKSHGFIDGNKRTAWVASRLFLAANDCALHFDPTEAVRMMEEVAAGACSEEKLTEWFRRRIMF